MVRWHSEVNRYRKEQRLDAAHGRAWELGHYRKRHALDCGNAQCGICHSDKFPKREQTRQEDLADLRFREQLND